MFFQPIPEFATKVSATTILQTSRMNTNLRHRLKNGDKLIATILSVPSPSVAEVLAETGFDALFIDGEHAPFGTGDIQAVIQAVDRDLPCIVRVAEPRELEIKKALDVGAAGVIVPMVNSAEQAAQMVSHARYSPEGSRGVGVARVQGYGMKLGEYLESANDKIAVIVQAEHIRAVENIEAIVKVPGIDGVLIGPYDLSASLGKMGKIDDPQVVAAIDRVTSACRNAGMPLGIFQVTAAAVRPYIERGFSFIVVGVDTILLGNAAQGLLKDVRHLIETGRES